MMQADFRLIKYTICTIMDVWNPCGDDFPDRPYLRAPPMPLRHRCQRSARQPSAKTAAGGGAGARASDRDQPCSRVFARQRPCHSAEDHSGTGIQYWHSRLSEVAIARSRPTLAKSWHQLWGPFPALAAKEASCVGAQWWLHHRWTNSLPNPNREWATMPP